EVCPEDSSQWSCQINFRHIQSIRRCMQPNMMRGQSIAADRKTGKKKDELTSCPANHFLPTAKKFDPINVPDQESGAPVVAKTNRVSPRNPSSQRRKGKK
ncbi:MAG: hypothetical protein K2X47_09365, partial [Bdellovibrionales bacterium]|nr:hypothetical protein [Bdellovibrionales bacterium]